MTADTPVPPEGFLLKDAKRFEHDPELAAARFSPCGKYLFGISYDRLEDLVAELQRSR